MKTQNQVVNQPPQVRLIQYDPWGQSKLMVGDTIYTKERWENINDIKTIREYINHGWYGRVLKVARNIGFRKEA